MWQSVIKGIVETRAEFYQVHPGAQRDIASMLMDPRLDPGVLPMFSCMYAETEVFV
jgi:hypothetical protein